MLELLLGSVLSLALFRALRARHVHAVASASVALYLLLADVIGAVAVTGPRQLFEVFNVAFLGIGVSATRAAAALPLPDLLIEHPIGLRVLRIAVCGVAAGICLQQSSRLNPLLPRAYALDGLAVPLAGAAIIDALICILLWLAMQLAARG